MEHAVTTPARMPQHLEALQRANRVRIARAELKRSVRRGELTAAEVIRQRPWEAETMTVGELLQTQPRWGRKRASRFLMRISVGENRTLVRLTARQQDLIASALEPRIDAELAAA